jgi:hypothetical protein
VTPQPTPTRFVYIGLFFVALATLMYEILLTRIFSVTMLYHFAFVALSVAMFGMTVGALLVYLLPAVFTTARLRFWLAAASIAFPVAIVLSFLTELSIPFRIYPSVVAIYAIVLTYLVIAVPFVVGGLVVCLTLTGFPGRVSRLYAADLTGAALGCLLLIPVLDYSDGPTAVLWVAVLAGCGAIAFTRDASPRLRSGAGAVTLLLAAAAAGHTALVWRHFPVFRILYVKGTLESRPLYEKWNSYSRVRVNGNPDVLVEPQGWGISRTLPAGVRVHQLQMDIDVVAGTVMTGYDGTPQSVPHLGYDVTNFAYRVRPGGATLVIGAGGGRDVLSALTLGARSVTAVEINKDILRTVNERFGGFTGHLDRDPRVRFVNDEARSYVARSADRFDLIQISLIDTWAATAAGAFVLSENAIYTSEAWRTFISHLTPDGMLSVSRWYYRDNPAEMYRTLTLAVNALNANGVANPRAHIAIVRNMTVANRPETPDGVGTLIVSRRPFTTEETSTIERTARALQFEVMLSPASSRDRLFEALAGPDAAVAIAGYRLRINPPSDDSPFFFNMLRLRDLARTDLLRSGKQSNNLIAVATLGILLATVLVLTVLCIFVPLAARRADARGARPLLVYFSAIGLGFMLIETSQMQRLIIALGHPTYALTVVLFGLLVSSGMGSYLTAGADAARGSLRLAILIAVLAATGLATPSVVHATAAGSTPVRVAAALALLFPAGIMLGMAFPLGMKIASASGRVAALTPWLWGLNGAASVVASVLSVCIALTWSISTAFWTGCAAYAVALAAYIRAVRDSSLVLP